MEALQIVIAGDAVLIKERLQRAIAGINGCRIVGIAVDEDAALALVCSLAPDVVILDIRKPHKNGIGFLKEIRRGAPAAVIVMYTADESVVLRDACLEAGANFYLNKTQMVELMDICRRLLADKSAGI